jgi:Flp pilus assembly protein TadB
MKLTDILILSLSLALIIVGIHQTLVNGVGTSYAIVMFAVGLLFWFQLRRNKNQDTSKEVGNRSTKTKKKK